MIVRKFSSNYDKVSYQVDCDGLTLDVVHERSNYGGVRTTPYSDFVDDIKGFDEEEAVMVKKFIRLQAEMMLNGVSFDVEVADGTKV